MGGGVICLRDKIFAFIKAVCCEVLQALLVYKKLQLHCLLKLLCICGVKIPLSVQHKNTKTFANLVCLGTFMIKFILL